MRIAVATLLTAALCSQSAHAAGVEEIDWWKGDVQAAFDQAKAERKPLFLYWGAVWCPPCNQIKRTIFARREFQEKMRVFLPVYLDGDTESAQIWGEKLEATGYPTMMVFSPDGVELVRLPGGLQVTQFIELLDETLAGMTPLGKVVEAALLASSGDAVPDSSYRVIAYHSWGQDTQLALTTAELERTFRALEAKIPARLRREKSRLFALWFEQAVKLQNEQTETPEGFKLSTSELADADVRVRAILADAELREANLDMVLLAAGNTVNALWSKPGPERTRLLTAWERTASGVESNPALSVDERLSALVPALEFLRMERGDKQLPEAFRKHVSERVAWAERASEDLYTRQAAMSTASWLLRQIGHDAEAKALLTAQLDKAVSPHYFMSTLSTLAQKDGDTEGAVGWMRQAYDTSKGRATRVQWGTSYLIGMIDLVPEQAPRIEDESLRVLRELLGFDDAFAGRNTARLRKLSKKYATWNVDGKRAAQIAKIRAEIAPGCAKLQGDGADPESARGRCEGYFNGLGAKDEG